ncbi:hypothetical protein F7725_013971, partial [Dissostichus mawsoni]
QCGRSGPVFKELVKNFSRSQGHGFIKPSHGGEDIFVHISDIDGEYVPMEGDEVTYKVCSIPPKNQKIQAVEVRITHLNPSPSTRPGPDRSSAPRRGPAGEETGIYLYVFWKKDRPEVFGY